MRLFSAPALFPPLLLRFSVVGHLLLLFAGALALQGRRIPVEDFARLDEMSDVKLSPDGEYLGFVRGPDGMKRLAFADIATMTTRAVGLGGGLIVPGQRGAANFDWIGPKRVIVKTTVGDYSGGWMAVDRDGRNRRALSGDAAAKPGVRLYATDFYPQDLMHAFDDDRTILVSNPRIDRGNREVLFPDVVRLDTRTALGTTVVRNPGNVIRWLTDAQGRVRLGVARSGSEVSLVYRDSEDEPWRTTVEFQADREVGPVAFTDEGHLYVRALTSQQTWGLRRFDPVGNTLLESVWQNPRYDFGVTVRSGEGRLLGVRYLADRPVTDWLDPRFVELQAQIDRWLPDRVNVLRSFSADGRRLLVSSSSDRQPTITYLYDAGKGGLTAVGRSRSWINPAEMAPMQTISYRARDGVRIEGYLTLPLGTSGQRLPMVVLPHGGPWARDVWGFDPFVQLLANRGYAVLQMNYRGSTGYGQLFAELGRRQIGGKIQEDIEDGTRWAIREGIADPARIAIVGASYGGYSALFAVGRSRGLYRCGISIAGVSDWVTIFESINTPEYEFSQVHWRREVGDPNENAQELKAISPVHFAASITAPLLIIHGRNDRIVPLRQARAMVKALKDAGHEPEVLYLRGEGHTILNEKARIAQYKAVEAFLEKHLGEGVTSGSSALPDNRVAGADGPELARHGSADLESENRAR